MAQHVNGTIIKGIAGFYYVKSGEAVYRCKARGIFKERGIRPAVGDMVEIEIIEGNDDSLVTEILPRKNSFIRPFVANVDCFVIVAAAAKPKPVTQIIDRLMVMAEKAETEIILCVSKCDLKGEQELLREIYEPLYPVAFLDREAEDGINRLKELIKGRKAALAGASGVGKSTILNRLIPDAMMDTGEISLKSQRGKHTTRHSQLFEMDDGSGTMIFDTPGFTSFEMPETEESELQNFYPEIAEYAGMCRYDNCRHLAEPGCRVKNALEEGRINPSRYESYRFQMEELRK